MTRYLISGWILLCVVITLIVWTFRPDMLAKAKAEITQPYREYKTEKNKTAWEKAYQVERAQWMLKNPLAAECNNPTTAVQEVECNTRSKEREQRFANVWRINVLKGWKPDDVIN
jgi:hypothetical protein